MKNAISLFLKKGGFLFFLLCFALLVNHRSGYVSLIGLFSLLVILFLIIKNGISRNSLLLIAYSVFYILLSTINGFDFNTPSNIVIYVLAPFVFYQYGETLVKLFDTDNFLVIAWLVIVICYCFDIFFASSRYFITTGQIINASRDFYLTSSSDAKISATLVGLPMDIGVLGLPMFFIAKNKWLRFSFLILFLLSLITTFSLLNRTGVVVAIVSFVILIAFRFRKDKTILLKAALILSILILGLSYFNILGQELFDMYADRNYDAATMGNRTQRWVFAVQNLFTSPLGWAEYGQEYYVHNMWLDVARVSGIIPFVILLYMAIDSFSKAFTLIRMNQNTIAYLVLGLNICFFLSCFVEPIYGGTHFMLYCMLWGTGTALVRKSKNID